ncbi:hypothetical protein TCAL_04139 [Tigriopus californicus]|uniref:Fe2OG dioxygenase domain-containing protein n=1 Tax=Tigriopus californicus TaxID=6832 RepID=A0A553NUG8_TIGCA|nr:2-oxoglutarate and iron-dependent oxygenase domain-containing protein 3-like [Tigriopus californicus]TRY69063.1 hypothetical protein TCAL_04139 [Tigriopus californicus]
MTVTQRSSQAAKSDPSVEGTASRPATARPKTATPFSGRYNPKLIKRISPETSDKGAALSHKQWTRMVTIGAIAMILYYTAKTGQTNTIMAKQSEVLESKRYQNSVCTPSYRQDIEKVGSKDCLPRKCGRVIMDDLLQESETEAILALAKKGLAQGGSSGGASILDLHSGALSQGEAFINVYKVYPDLFTRSEFEVYKSVKDRVKAAVAEHFGLNNDHLFLSHPTFFSRITAAPAQTLHDEYWHVHIDKETYPSFHYTSLLYLTDFGIDFQGGSFVFVDAHDNMNRTIEPRMGRVSAFTSGIENKHHVERVTSGIRYALTMGFTCDPSQAIPNPGDDLP